MDEKPSLPKRKNLRLKNYDYDSPGHYFVTICTENRECLLGDIRNGHVELNDLGRMVHSIWSELPQNYTGVSIDEFVVMPNHLHAIVILGVGAGHCARPNHGQARGPAPTLSLSDVIQRFKSFTTNRYSKLVSRNKTAISLKLWQRNYYEHVIRSDGSLDNIREYILQNPLKWAEDENNPQNKNYLGQPKIRPYN